MNWQVYRTNYLHDKVSPAQFFIWYLLVAQIFCPFYWWVTVFFCCFFCLLFLSDQDSSHYACVRMFV